MAASADTRELQLQISASAELLIRNLKTADSAVADFQKTTDTRLASIDGRFAALGKLKNGLGSLDTSIGLGGIIGVATGATLIDLTKRGLDFASSLQETAQQLGVTTEGLQTFRYAGSQYGIETEEMDKALGKLTQTMGKAEVGAKEPAKAFNALGISIASIKGKTADEIIPRIADALSKIKDPAQRAALEVALFGKAGQKLDTLLTQGSAGINGLAKAAKDLGLVLSDDQIANADNAADKLSEVKQVLQADIASTVANNAVAILHLAEALERLATASLHFASDYPQAIGAGLGGLIGFRVGGPVGAAIGVAAGLYGGMAAKRDADDANMDPRFRAQKLGEARQAYTSARQSSGAVRNVGGTYGIGGVGLESDGAVALGAARIELQKQITLTGQAVTAARAPKKKGGTPVLDGGGDAKQFMAEGKSADQLAREAEAKRRAAEAAAKKDRADQRKANDLETRGLLDVQSGKADLANDPDERLKIEEQRVDLARAGKDADLENEALDNKYIAANLTRLKAINAEGAEIDKAVLVQKRSQEEAEAGVQRREAATQDAIAVDEIQARLAVVAKDRYALEKRVLAERQQQERNALADVIEDGTGRYTPDQKRAATEARARLPERQAAERSDLAKQQQGPLANYRDQLKSATGDMSEALQNVQVHGLQSLEDGLLGVIDGTESVGDAFKKMASSIIADLARIAIEKLIVKAIGSSFLGFAEGGVVPGYATGGVIDGIIQGPGTGTSDSILARVSRGEGILTAAAVSHYGADAVDALNRRDLPKFATGGVVGRLPSVRASVLPSLSGRGGRDRVDVNSTIKLEPSPLFAATVQQTTLRTVAASAEPIMAGAEARTRKGLSRPSLPGGWG